MFSICSPEVSFYVKFIQFRHQVLQLMRFSLGKICVKNWFFVYSAQCPILWNLWFGQFDICVSAAPVTDKFMVFFLFLLNWNPAININFTQCDPNAQFFGISVLDNLICVSAAQFIVFSLALLYSEGPPSRLLLCSLLIYSFCSTQ